MPVAARLFALCLCAGPSLALSACDDSPAARQATQTPAPVAAGPAAGDACLVGTWKSTGISGSFTIGSAVIKLAGGAGEVLTIDAGGHIHTDDTNSAPVGGTAPDGTDYRLVQTGTATGTIASAGGRIKVNLNQPTNLTVSLYKNGNVIQSQHPGSANDSYTCVARASLVITGGGGTVTRYAPG
jgi:hypothetical protein